MSKLFLTIFMVLFLSGGVFLAAQNASAGVTGTDFGLGPGCSAIEGVDATTLVGSGGTCDKTNGLCDDTTACTSDAACAGIGSGLCNGVCTNDVNVTCTADAECAAGDMFTGEIGKTAVNRLNKNLKPADNSDTDQCSDSLEECINSSLFGFCTEVLVDDCDDVDTAGGPSSPLVTYDPGVVTGPQNNRRQFKVTFEDVSGCAITECSDRVENEFCDKSAGLCDDTTTACTVDSPDCDTIGTGLCNGVCSDDASACTAGSGCFDGAIDFPDDPECTDFSDDDESS